MFTIARWFNGFQAPVVLMIDDLSDAYVDVYPESHKNDWGYMCDLEGSSYSYLKSGLLDLFPHIKMTFFVPYLRHNVINENSKYSFAKYDLGERDEYKDFLSLLDGQGHEIAHHGSDHGEYIDDTMPTTINNWTHEWALFKDVETGVQTTLRGVEKFKEVCDIDVSGGKYCGYISIENSQEIIDRCDLLYWCERPNLDFDDYSEASFGSNEVISFPTTVAGNAFVRLSYLTGNPRKDKKKQFLKYLQPLYDVLSYLRIYKHYKNSHIISIQEHYSPSTTSGLVQSANIVSDIKSLNKTFSFLQHLSIWYATCDEIATYIYVREHSKLTLVGDELHIDFDCGRTLKDPVITIANDEPFRLEDDDHTYVSVENNDSHVVDLPIKSGDNLFFIK